MVVMLVVIAVFVVLVLVVVLLTKGDVMGTSKVPGWMEPAGMLTGDITGPATVSADLTSKDVTKPGKPCLTGTTGGCIGVGL